MYTRDVNELIITACYRAHVVCMLQHYQKHWTLIGWNWVTWWAI